MNPLAPLLLAALAAPPLQDWARFRGPGGSGTTAATALPSVLDPAKNVAWRTEVPPGYSSPIVVGERLFLTAVRDETCVTICLDALTGETLWTAEAPEARHEWKETTNTPASPTPTSDGERVFVLFPTFGVVAYDLDGKLSWTHPMERFRVPHGMSSSPVAVRAGERRLVLLQVDQDANSHLLALDARTGETVWDTERPGVTHGYASPVAWFPEGAETGGIVLTNGAFRAIAYSLDDGTPLWWFDDMGWDTSIVPLVNDGLLFVGSNGPPLTDLGAADLTGTWEEALAARDADGDGLLTAAEWDHPGMERLWYYYDLDGDGSMDAEEHAYALRRQETRARMVAIATDGEGDVTDSHLVWSYEDRRGLPNVGSPLLVDGVLFLVKDSIVTTLRAKDGSVVKQARAGGIGESMASPVAADGKVYLASTAGVLTVLSAEAEWDVLGQAELDEEVWSTPAIAHESVYVRSQQAVYRFRKPE